VAGLTGPFERAPSLFLLFLQEIISEGRSFSAEILGRRPRGERNNSEDNGLFERAGRRQVMPMDELLLQ
jgi:hypothetical protein